MALPHITIVGTLTADPELRFTPSGAAVANFTVAANDRYKKDGEWVDGDTLFARCNVWKEQAENVAESLFKGLQVIVTGKLKQRSYETREGEKRTVQEVEVDNVGPALRFATAKVTKQGRKGGGGSSSSSGGNEDPWGNSQASDGPDW